MLCGYCGSYEYGSQRVGNGARNGAVRMIARDRVARFAFSAVSGA